jgi:tetratricopeptide (TPR) repeat protein
MPVAMLKRALLLAVLSGLSLSVASAKEARWVVVSSPNFRVYTDAGEKQGREVALHFEQMRFVFGKLLQRAKVQTGFPVHVIAFRNRKEFRTVAPLWKGKPKELTGLYIGGEDVAFVGLDLSSEQSLATVFHEYAHLLLNANVESKPLWFDEGFAEYYSTTRIDKSEWILGSLPDYAVPLLANNRLISLVDLFSAEHDSPLYNDDNRSLFYAESWLAVEYFWFNPDRNKQLLEYFALRAKDVPVMEAMRRAFGKEPAQLDKEFTQFLRTGHVQVSRYKTPPALDALEMKVTALDDADARAAVEEMRLYESDYTEQARKELEKILAKRPGQPSAARGLGAILLHEGDYSKAAAYLEPLVNSGSDDARVYFYWAAAVKQTGEGESEQMQARMQTALEKCIALDPQFPDAYGLLTHRRYQWQRLVQPHDRSGAAKLRL